MGQTGNDWCERCEALQQYIQQMGEHIVQLQWEK